MSFNQPSDQEGQNRPSHEFKNVKNIPDEKGGIFFSRVNNFFTWLGTLITEEARSEAQEGDTLPKKPLITLLREQHPDEVRNKAQIICENLEQLKTQLAAKFEGSTGGFITKSIDTMILQAKRIIDTLHTRDPRSHGFQDFLTQAIADVELYSQLNSETKIKRKIVQEAHEFIKQAIDKDINVLVNYKLQAVTDLSLPSNGKTNHNDKLDRFLNPVISELQGICEFQFDSVDLEVFFAWKATVDERRGALVELGLLTIDALTSPFKVQETASTDQEQEEAIEFDSTAMKNQIEDYSLSLSFLSNLEDRVAKCLELLEQIPTTDNESLKLIEQLISDLKVDEARLTDFEVESPSMQKGFHSLKESIKKADLLLRSKINHKVI